MEQKKFAQHTAYIAQRAFELNEKARKDGLAALKDSIKTDSKTNRDIFEYGMMLCTSGFDQEQLNNILTNLIKTEKNPLEKRFKTIQKEAVMLIQKGFHSRLLLNAVFSYLTKEELDETQRLIKDSKLLNHFTRLLEKPFEKTETNNDNLLSDDHNINIPYFDSIRSAEQGQLLELIKNENNDTIAFILAFIDSKKAAYILTNLPEVIQNDIAKKIAIMDKPALPLLMDVLKLEKKISNNTGKKCPLAKSEEFKQLLKLYLVNENKINEAQKLYKEACEIKTGSPLLEEENVKRLLSAIQGTAYDFLFTNPSNLINMLLNEHPKTISYVLASIKPKKAALILDNLPRNIQVLTAQYIAFFSLCPQNVKRMEKSLSALFNKDISITNSFNLFMEILFHTDRDTEKYIIETLEEENPEFAEKIKKRLFVFEDIVILDNRAIERVLRNTDYHDLAIALKNTTPQAEEKIFSAMSKRAAIMLKDDMECIGDVSMTDNEEAKNKIVSVIRLMEEIGELIVAGADEQLV